MASHSGQVELGSNDLLRTTLRGLKRGTLSSTTDDAKIKCVVLCHSFLSLLVSRGFLQYYTPVVVIGHKSLLQILHSVCHSTTVLGSFDNLDDPVITSVACTATVCFGDRCLNSGLCEWLIGMDISIVVTTHSPRRIHSSWRRTVSIINHWDFGGVTDHTQRIFIFCQYEPTLNSIESFKHARDAHTILDDSVWTSIKRRAPTMRKIHPLQVKNVGSTSVPLYHIGGLLPRVGLKSCRVITPSIGLPKGTWGIRKLTTSEILLALDISPDLIPVSTHLLPFLDDLSPPARIWELSGHLVMTFPRAFMPDSEAVPRPPKRLKIDVFHPPCLGVAQDQLLSTLHANKSEQVAVKADTAAVNTDMWLDHFLDEGGSFFAHVPVHTLHVALDCCRTFFLVTWKKRLLREYAAYLLDKFSAWQTYRTALNISHWVERSAEGSYMWSQDGRATYQRAWRQRQILTKSEWMKGADALVRALRSSWWEWEDGSAPFYWRWPTWYQPFIRDGISFPFHRTPPKYMVPQRDIDDQRRKELVTEKLHKVVDRRYMGPGVVKSLTAFFDVPKGLDDIRMVYDGTINGFNDSIEVPKFGLPTLRSHLRAMAPGYHMVDADVGECFLNFHLHDTLQPFVGVDLSCFQKRGTKGRCWMRWYRAGMGLKSSPYQACQAMMVVEEIIKGDRSDPTNPFRWDVVVINLPGSPDYDPTMPWTYKIRTSDGKISCDIFIYVDDLRVTGCTKSEAWSACCRATSIVGYLGVQDAPRKRRKSSNVAGAWAGSVVYTTKERVLVLVTEEKWIKAKSQIDELKEMIEDPTVKRKRLQEIRGFLNYLGNIYPLLLSYLMGLHLTIDGWRRGRDISGWRIRYKDLI